MFLIHWWYKNNLRTFWFTHRHLFFLGCAPAKMKIIIISLLISKPILYSRDCTICTMHAIQLIFHSSAWIVSLQTKKLRPKIRRRIECTVHMQLILQELAQVSPFLCSGPAGPSGSLVSESTHGPHQQLLWPFIGLASRRLLLFRCHSHFRGYWPELDKRPDGPISSFRFFSSFNSEMPTKIEKQETYDGKWNGCAEEQSKIEKNMDESAR